MDLIYKRALAVSILLISAVAVGYSQTPTPSPAAPAQNAAYVRPDKQQRIRSYIKSMFGFSALAKNVASAGVSTWTNAPDEWGPHWGGFGKRFASNMGKGIIKNTTAFGLEEAFKLDSRYVPAAGKPVGQRIGNALISPFVARNQYGRKVFGLPRIAGTFASSIIAVKTWYPANDGWKDGMRNGAVSLGTSALFNLIKEFAHRK
jgi:hypothetical protein